ncbi:probable G-protein coupled receptor Mth-like 1 [Hetaerina americana]|uniref:probable G-protein coupled receptor Mth-like 1 n=1 Tax=Hetaerina americana TaxID=62018 RepID=UPI003A7F56DB
MSVTVHYPSVFENGSVWDPVGGSLYPPGTYWLHDGRRAAGGWGLYRGCPCLLENPCLRKCCPVGESLDGVGGCVPMESHFFSPNVTDDDGANSRTIDADERFGVLYGLSCVGMTMLDPGERPEDHFFVRASDGTLSLPLRNHSSFHPSDFCLDYVSPKGTYLPLLCGRARHSGWGGGAPQWLSLSFPLLLLLSTSFLLVTFFSFALVPDLRNSLHGRSVMCLITSLVMGCVFLAMVQLTGEALTVNNCIASAYVMQFSFHAAFFWLNTMCFDSCNAFRKLKPNPSLASKKEERWFITYSTYAWGVPLVIVSIGVAMDFYLNPSVDVVRPRFGQPRCWFFTRGGALIYFYAPVVIILLLNLIMLIVTAVRITKGKKEPAMLRITGSTNPDEKNTKRYILYLKMFIIMSINFVMELISWIVGGPDVFWYISDIGYTLQGILFFVILVWKDRIHHILLKRLQFCPASNEVQETALSVI